MFFNTTNETNPDLTEYRQKALNQDERVLELFRARIQASYTPSEVLSAAFDRTPITSVRRSMSNLTDEGRLVKTDGKREGIYGRPEHVWVLAKSCVNQLEMW